MEQEGTSAGNASRDNGLRTTATAGRPVGHVDLAKFKEVAHRTWIEGAEKKYAIGKETRNGSIV